MDQSSGDDTMDGGTELMENPGETGGAARAETSGGEPEIAGEKETQESVDEKNLSMLDSLVRKLAEDSTPSNPESPAPLEGTSTSSRKSGSSRRKPKVTRKFVESEEDEDTMTNIEDMYVEEKDLSNIEQEQAMIVEDQAVDSPETDSKQEMPMDSEGNPVLPEGTIVVQPEAVFDPEPEYKGPEFETRSKKFDKDLSSVHCTACGKQVNHRIAGKAMRHPVLKTLLCKKCYKYYTSDKFDQDSDGMDEQCRWCAEGGNLLLCDFCHNAFCKGCIKRNLGRAELAAVTGGGDDFKWKCYVCNPLPLTNAVQHCDKVFKIIEQDKKETEKEKKKAVRPKPRPKPAPKSQSKQNTISGLARSNPVRSGPVPVQLHANSANLAMKPSIKIELEAKYVDVMIEKLIAATHSMTMLLKALRDEVTRADRFAAGGKIRTGFNKPKGMKTRLSVTQKLHQAITTYKSTLGNVGEIARISHQKDMQNKALQLQIQRSVEMERQRRMAAKVQVAPVVNTIDDDDDDIEIIEEHYSSPSHDTVMVQMDTSSRTQIVIDPEKETCVTVSTSKNTTESEEDDDDDDSKPSTNGNCDDRARNKRGHDSDDDDDGEKRGSKGSKGSSQSPWFRLKLGSGKSGKSDDSKSFKKDSSGSNSEAQETPAENDAIETELSCSEDQKRTPNSSDGESKRKGTNKLSLKNIKKESTHSKTGEKKKINNETEETKNEKQTETLNERSMKKLKPRKEELMPLKEELSTKSEGSSVKSDVESGETDISDSDTKNVRQKKEKETEDSGKEDDNTKPWKISGINDESDASKGETENVGEAFSRFMEEMEPFSALGNSDSDDDDLTEGVSTAAGTEDEGTVNTEDSTAGSEEEGEVKRSAKTGKGIKDKKQSDENKEKNGKFKLSKGKEPSKLNQSDESESESENEDDKIKMNRSPKKEDKKTVNGKNTNTGSGSGSEDLCEKMDVEDDSSSEVIHSTPQKKSKKKSERHLSTSDSEVKSKIKGTKISIHNDQKSKKTDKTKESEESGNETEISKQLNSSNLEAQRQLLKELQEESSSGSNSDSRSSDSDSLGISGSDSDFSSKSRKKKPKNKAKKQEIKVKKQGMRPKSKLQRIVERKRRESFSSLKLPYKDDPKIMTNVKVVIDKTNFLDLNSDSEKSELKKKSVAKSKEEKSRKHDSDDSNYDSDLEREIDRLSKPVVIAKKKKKETKKEKVEVDEKAKNTKEKKEKKENKKGVMFSSSESDAGESSGVEEEEIDEEIENDIAKEEIEARKAKENIEDEDENRRARNAMMADSDSDQSESSDESESDSSGKVTKKKSSKSKKKDDDDSSDSDFVSPKKKSLQRSALLREKLSEDSDSDVKTVKKKGAKKAGQKENKTKKKKGKASGSDMDDSDSDFQKKKRKPRKKKSSSSSLESMSDSDSDVKPKKKAKKRKRIQMASDSSDNSGSGDDVTASGGKGKRKKIRKILKDSKLKQETKSAAKAEEERRQRIKDRQKEFNLVLMEEDATSPTKCPVAKQLVLEMDKETKKPIIEVDKKLVKHLKPHQVEAVQFMYDCLVESMEQLEKNPEGSGCILAHCMGLGKTLSVVTTVYTLLTHPDVLPFKTCLVLCPLNTVLNWQSECTERWFSYDDQLDVYELSSVKNNWGRADQLSSWHKDGGIMIMGYEMFRNLSQLRRIKNKKQKKIFTETLLDPGPDIIVCDEGHILKNEASAISKATMQIKSQRRVVLTGTPLQNNLKEYHCMVNFVKPNLLGTSKEFGNRFINPITNGQCSDSTQHDVKIMKRRAHILHDLLSGCVQRKDYSALTKFLPPKFEYVISIRLSEVQIKLYEKYLEVGQSQQGSMGKGARLFSDYQSLMRIWTHPYVLRMEQIRRENRVGYDEDSMDDFLDDSEMDSFLDDSTPDSSDSEDSMLGMAKDKKKKKKGRKNSGSGSDVEVVNEWKTRRRRGRGDGDDPDAGPSNSNDIDELPSIWSQEWWTEYVDQESQNKLELSGKLMLLCEVLKMAEEIGDKVLVFSQSLLSLDIIEHFLKEMGKQNQEDEESEGNTHGFGTWLKGIDYFRMDGSTQAHIRKKWCDWFNESDNYRARLFLISTKAGSLGINLVSANRCIIFDASWNPSHDVQSIFRVYRFGQDKPCYVYRFLAQGAMEEKIYERQVTKLSLSSRVVDEHQVERHFTAQDLNELYNFKPDRYKEGEERETPVLPKDRVLAELLSTQAAWISSYHEHDSLLENQVDQELTEEERKAAWEEYENIKKGVYPNQQQGRPMINPAWEQMVNPYQQPYQPQYELDQNMINQMCQSIVRSQPNITQTELQARLQAVIRYQKERIEMQQQQAMQRLRIMQQQRLLQEATMNQYQRNRNLTAQNQPENIRNNSALFSALTTPTGSSQDKSDIYRSLLQK